ncbi:PapB/FocB family fimbrial expression transcriptional regulator [Escherichia albertii]|nr:PapB/FocB family fimbrial expression transcriptional regulator [Escherichia albertii]
MPGEVPEEFFWLLIELSPFRSEKVICALRDFLVLGYTRREVCERYHISYGHLSLAFKRLRHVNEVVCQIVVVFPH